MSWMNERKSQTNERKSQTNERKSRAKRLLVHYFKLCYEAGTGMGFNPANEPEIEAIIDSIFDEISDEISDVRNVADFAAEHAHGWEI